MGVKCSGCGVENTGWIPEDRLSKAVADRQTAQSALDAATAELEQLRASAEVAETKRAEAEATATALQGERSSWATERQLMLAGVTDPEGLQIAQILWDRMEADQRPESISQWVHSEAAPRAIRAYIPSPEAAPAPAPAPAEPAPTPPPAEAAPARPALPNGNAGIMPRTPQHQQWDAAAVSQVKKSATDYAPHREAILAELARERRGG